MCSICHSVDKSTPSLILHRSHTQSVWRTTNPTKTSASSTASTASTNSASTAGSRPGRIRVRPAGPRVSRSNSSRKLRQNPSVRFDVPIPLVAFQPSPRHDDVCLCSSSHYPNKTTKFQVPSEPDRACNDHLTSQANVTWLKRRDGFRGSSLTVRDRD